MVSIRMIAISILGLYGLANAQCIQGSDWEYIGCRTDDFLSTEHVGRLLECMRGNSEADQPVNGPGDAIPGNDNVVGWFLNDVQISIVRRVQGETCINIQGLDEIMWEVASNDECLGHEWNYTGEFNAAYSDQVNILPCDSVYGCGNRFEWAVDCAANGFPL